MSKKGTTINAWHKDGVIQKDDILLGNVYQDGELKKTGGKWEMITIVLSPTKKKA